jgi:tRNA(Ile)-lysidine synthase
MPPDPAVAACRVAVRRRLAGLPPGELVLVACSGGADSVALAAALAFEAPRAGLRAGLLTVEHGLQDGSARQAASVLAWARESGLEPAEAMPVTVGRDGGPEAAARAARYAALDAAAERLGAVLVLLGHTRDDQAETVLLRLARGSGARSLAGMPVRTGRYARPFLDLPRATTQAACAALHLRFWDDPQNHDPAFTRARVRAEALPALERALGPGVAAALARTAGLLRDDADALDAWADSVLATADTGAQLRVEPLAGLPAAVRRRVLRAAAVRAGAPAGSLGEVHVRALEALVVDWHGQGPAGLPGRLEGVRRCDRLSFVERTS